MLHARLRAAAGRDRIPTDGLVAHYTMDNISGSTIFDEAGAHDANKGSGVTFSSGAIGNAAVFSGSSDAWIDIPHASVFNGDLSISFLLKASPKSSDLSGLFYKAPGTDFNRVFGSEILGSSSGGTIEASVSSGSALYKASSTSAPSSSSYVHVCLIFTSTRLAVYLNGAKEGENTFSISRVTNSEKITIGRVASSSTSARHLNGDMDQVRIYSRELTDDEVVQLSNEGA